MTISEHLPLSRISLLERTGPSLQGLTDLDLEIHRSLSSLNIPPEKLQKRRIAITVGSRGVATLAEVTRATCDWLKKNGAVPFVIPAMGSHGGATAEGQREVLEGYGVTPDFIGAEICASMDTVPLGSTPEGFGVFMDRYAFDADGILVMNRVKPHTDFSGAIESGLLKMIAIGLGKTTGAREAHRWFRKYGFEPVIRSMSEKVLGSGRILCGLAVVENELHQIAGVRASLPADLAAQEEAALKIARGLVPRIPFSKIDLLIVDEIGKNISGTSMDTKVIGRGLDKSQMPLDSPQIRVIYARNLTSVSEGNATGVRLADVIHERLYRKIDHEKTTMNIRTSLNLPLAGTPMHCPSDRDALDYAFGCIGSPAPEEQRIVWICNTLSLGRIGISQSLARDAADLQGWRLTPEALTIDFDATGNVHSPL
jgi:Domain of unknown function (DUF362)